MLRDRGIDRRIYAKIGKITDRGIDRRMYVRIGINRRIDNR